MQIQKETELSIYLYQYVHIRSCSWSNGTLAPEWQKEGTAVPHGRRQLSIYVKGFDFYRKGGNFWGCLW